MQSKPKTFVASIRTDLRDIASLAVYLNKRSERESGEILGTPSRIASKAVETLAEITQQKHPVRTQAEAVSILRQLGYKDPLAEGTRYFKALVKEIKQEKTIESQLEQDCKIVQDLMNSGEYLSKNKSEKPSEEELTQLQAEGLIAPNDSTSSTSPNALTSAELEADQSKHATEIKTMQDGFASGTPEIATDP